MIPIPKGPWEMLGTEIFQLSGKKYLLVVDYYSKYIELALLEKGENSSRIIEKLKSIFSRHGIPDQVISDNGPQYASLEFKEFTKVYKFKHITSSPRYPKGNGMAERAVQTVKRLLEKCEDPYLSMLEYRTTPLEFGLSPGELLMNRKLTSIVPLIQNRKIVNEEQHTEYREWQEKKIKRIKNKYDSNPKVKDLKKLSIGDYVYIKDLDRPAKVIEVNQNERSYTVEGEGIVRRNRSALIETGEATYTTRSGRIINPPKRYTE